MKGFAQKVGRSLATYPGAEAWRRTLFEAAWSVPLLLTVALLEGLIHPGGSGDSGHLLRLALVALVAPAFGEELLFRAALLPAPGAPAPGWRHVVPVLLFVAWHPAQALIFGPQWAAVVLDPWFLLAVLVLGIALTRLYLATGSIWPCVALHWAVVVGWKALGGPSPWPSG
jgi:uncharacterized protein